MLATEIHAVTNLKHWHMAVRWAIAVIAYAFTVSYVLSTDGRIEQKEQAEKSNFGDMAKSLESKGYKRFPLVRDRLGSLHFKFRLGGRLRNALIDTGAENTFFSEALAKEIKCDLSGESKSYDNIGGSVSMKRSRIPESYGKGDLAFISDVIVCEDFERKMFAGDREKNGVEILIGMDTLRYHSAIIDCGGPALYIREADAIDEGLNGEWRAVTYIREGMLVDGEISKAISLSIGENTLMYNNGKRAIPFGLNLHDCNRIPKAMDWRVEKGSACLPAIYSLDSDTLKICGNLTQSKTLLRPNCFDSTEFNGYSVITFHRVLPKDGQAPVPKKVSKPSANVDLKALLEPVGYKRFSLKREPLGTLYLPYTLLGTKCTALLDTGASATFMSDGLARVAKLHLSSESKVVACIGGSLSMKTAKIPKESTKEFAFPGDVFVCENYTEKIKEKVFASNTENVDVEMILGMDIAKHYSAVIDTHAPALYFYTK